MSKEEKAKEILIQLKKLYPNAKIELDFNNPIELLVAVVLSAQSTDKQVNIVTSDLFKKYKSINDYIDAPLSGFEKDINSIGLYRGKAKNIKATLEIINKNHNSKIPDSMDALVKLPGVGRKTANILLFNIYGKNEGIAVDTHVKRLSGRLGLTDQTNPDKIEKELMKILPQNEWGAFSSRLVLYGRYVCRASCKHLDCPLRSFIP